MASIKSIVKHIAEEGVQGFGFGFIFIFIGVGLILGVGGYSDLKIGRYFMLFGIFIILVRWIIFY
ncbi:MULTISPECIES: hypothetical protein [Methylomonas]|uniref:hypothetical protein n=1 Tax=Methylomonas TaxID=416 RepID=UPI001E507B7D|nr:hypothetical protein [Methylomonas rhizoryzae]